MKTQGVILKYNLNAFGNKSIWIRARCLATKYTSILTSVKQFNIINHGNYAQQLEMLSSINMINVSCQVAFVLNGITLWFQIFRGLMFQTIEKPRSRGFIVKIIFIGDGHFFILRLIILIYSSWAFSELCIVIPRLLLINRFTSAQWKRLMACLYVANWCNTSTRLKICPSNVQVWSWRSLHALLLSELLCRDDDELSLHLGEFDYMINFRNKF